MVQVSSIQAQTISARAVAHLTSTNPIQIPGNTLTQPVATALNALITAQMKPVLAQVRADLGLHVRHRTIGGTPVVVITPRRIERKRRRAAGFFAHGGAFALLSAKDYNAYWMAHDLGVVVYSVDYSLSPQSRFPVALTETFAAYCAVSKRYRKVVVAGSSAGANLLVTTIRRACRGDADPPEAAGFFAPAVDLRALGDSYLANDGRDPLVTRDAITKFMAAYLGATSATDPDASPVLADYSDGFVPTVLTTGTRDLLQSDSARFYRTLRSAGVPVRLRVREGMWHAFEGVPDLPEGEQAMREVFDFLEMHL